MRLRARAAARRRRAGRLARESIASQRAQKLLLALGAFFTALPHAAAPDATAPLRDWARGALDKRQRKLRKRVRHAQRLAPHERHRARVAAKTLRYTAELLASLFPAKRTDAYVKALSRLQSSLGRLNDLEVAATLVDELAPRDEADAGVAYAGGVVRGWLAASIRAEQRRLRDAQRAFRRCTPFWNT
jgi:CHAD domain-containing protein